MIEPQIKAKRGSQRWLQDVINRKPHLVSNKIAAEARLPKSTKIEWLSPLTSERYAEYRDGAFLKRLGLFGYSEQLKEFWPQRGPQWDALGRVSEDGPFFLVEAKANIPEIVSDYGAKAESSIEKIENSFRKTQKWLGCMAHVDWKTSFYQYGNRLAHLYFLREILHKQAFLVFLYFENDTTHIRTSHDEWIGSLKLQRQLMGLQQHRQKKYILEVFMDVNQVGKSPRKRR